MNFIAGVLLYHSGEVNAFWLLCTLMTKYKLNHVLQPGFPGIEAHSNQIQKLIENKLPLLDKHFQKMDVTVNLFTTEWVLSIFLSFIPIELSNIYLDKFFEKGWEVLYRVAIEVLRYF